MFIIPGNTLYSFLLTSKYFVQDCRCLLFLGIHCELQVRKEIIFKNN